LELVSHQLFASSLLDKCHTIWAPPPAQPWYSFFFGRTRIWIQGFMLAKQVFYHLSHTSSPFCSGYFCRWGLENYLPGLVLNRDFSNLSLPKNLGLQACAWLVNVLFKIWAYWLYLSVFLSS
jgi:hypothetical protein